MVYNRYGFCNETKKHVKFIILFFFFDTFYKLIFREKHFVINLIIISISIK